MHKPYTYLFICMYYVELFASDVLLFCNMLHRPERSSLNFDFKHKAYVYPC